MNRWQHDRDSAIRWARGMVQRDFVVLDLETTGLAHDDEAVSIGIIDNQGNVLLDTLLRHEKQSHPKAQDTHGISWAMTRNAPRFTKVWPALIELTQDKFLVIYNANYDIRIIEQMMRRYKIDALSVFRGDASCAMNVFAKFYGAWNDYRQSYTWQKLTTAANHLGINTKGAHGAAVDALITLRVIEGMAKAKLREEAKQ